MSLKIDASMSAVAHHIVDGAVTFPYAIDAHHAASQHPAEWKLTPWTAEETAAARKESGAPDVEMTDEERAALEEHTKAVAEANERLAAFKAKKEAERQEALQVAQDEAIVASAPPRPDPNVKRPFGRKGEPTQAEIDAHNKREAKKADDERIAKEKADADKMSGSNAKMTQ